MNEACKEAIEGVVKGRGSIIVNCLYMSNDLYFDRLYILELRLPLLGTERQANAGSCVGLLSLLHKLKPIKNQCPQKEAIINKTHTKAWKKYCAILPISFYVSKDREQPGLNRFNSHEGKTPYTVSIFGYEYFYKFRDTMIVLNIVRKKWYFDFRVQCMREKFIREVVYIQSQKCGRTDFVWEKLTYGTNGRDKESANQNTRKRYVQTRCARGKASTWHSTFHIYTKSNYSISP